MSLKEARAKRMDIQWHKVPPVLAPKFLGTQVLRDYPLERYCGSPRVPRGGSQCPVGECFPSFVALALHCPLEIQLLFQRWVFGA